jgi:tRNA 2-thiocytidine biosynthesis protein TtcA
MANRFTSGDTLHNCERLEIRRSSVAVIEGPEFYISKRVGKAIMDYQMLAEGDKVLVAVSGGKDSLTLLRVLNDRRAFVPIKYELLAGHIDMGYPCHHPKILAEYFKKHQINYHIEKIDILQGKTRKEISCFWCSWNRRKALFEVADRFGCTKVALGHHHDDIVETMLLNLFFHGEISAMSPKQLLFKGKIVIIRPLAYTEEEMILRFARQADFPHHKCVCPNSLTSRRTKIGEILSELQRECPEVKKNIFRSLQRIKKDYLL